MTPNFKNNAQQSIIPSLVDSLQEYFDLHRKLFASFSQVKSSQQEMFDLINGRFQLFDIVMRDIIQTNKTRKKKYWEIYQDESSKLLEKTGILFHSFKTDEKMMEGWGQTLENISKGILEQIQTLKFDVISPFSPAKTHDLLQSNQKPQTLSFRKSHHEEEMTSSRRDGLSSNRLLISKARAFESILFQDQSSFADQKKQYFNEKSHEKLKIHKKQTIEEEIADVKSSRQELLSSNRLLVSTKTKAFESVLSQALCSFANQKKQYFNERIHLMSRKNDDNLSGDKENHESSCKNPRKSEKEKEKENCNKISKTPNQKEQKTRILDLMKTEYGLEVDETNFLLCHRANHGKENQSKYVIDAKWWRDWVHYVGLVSKNDETKRSTALNPGKIINSGLLKEEFLSSQNIERCRFFLKDYLLEHHDYEALPRKIFKNLKKWYSVDYEIIRFLKIDPLDPKKLVLDLYDGFS